MDWDQPRQKLWDTPIQPIKSCMWWHTCHPAMREGYTGGLQPRQNCKTLFKKTKAKRAWGNGSSGRAWGPEFKPKYCKKTFQYANTQNYMTKHHKILISRIGGCNRYKQYPPYFHQRLRISGLEDLYSLFSSLKHTAKCIHCCSLQVIILSPPSLHFSHSSHLIDSKLIIEIWFWNIPCSKWGRLRKGKGGHRKGRG
jgi:hypothetical protein